MSDFDNDEDPEKILLSRLERYRTNLKLKRIIEKDNIKTIIIAIDTPLDYKTRMDISECFPHGLKMENVSFL